MNKIKHITVPDLKSAKKLTPLELNSFKCQRKHTLLTPDLLERISRSASSSAN